MISAPNAGPFASYNARGDDPATVADTFIAPEFYWDLTSSGNHVLIGPRGSGKTTLMKMLLPRGLNALRDDQDGRRARSNVQFAGVFVPADKMWSGQVGRLTLRMDPAVRRQVGLAVFTTMTLRAMVQHARERLDPCDRDDAHSRVELSRADEARLARDIAEIWMLPLRVSGFDSLAGALTQMLTELNAHATRASAVDADRTHRRALLDLHAMNQHFFTAAAAFAHSFNAVADERDRRWTFLIDELEFLPLGAQAEITEAVSGQDPILGFKFSIAPYTGTAPLGGIGKLPIHDFTRVKLSVAGSTKKRAEDFARRLLEQEIDIQARGLTLNAILGPTPIDWDGEDDAYGPRSANRRALFQLAKIDPSFRRWLDERNVDLERLQDLSAAERASTIRKAAPLARFRLAYRKQGKSGLAGRSRKVTGLYAGTEAVCRMSEGNPRWVKVLAFFLVRAYRGRRLTLTRQEVILERIADEYLGHLRAVDVETNADVGDEAPPHDPKAITPHDFIERLGRYFAMQVLEADFTPDPRTVAALDLRDPWIDSVLHSAMFLGAVTSVERGKSPYPRARLSYMFAPHFKLPLRLGKDVRLSTILATRKHAGGSQLSIESDAHAEEPSA